jgi:threonine dehydrogenase-like Zn-dependent dehydrogenase
MCSNGRYTERGIKELDGFMIERWRIEPDYAVRVDRSLGLLGVLLEPTTVVAKAWAHIFAIAQRTFWEGRTVLVVGAGPIGLLAALIGVQLRGEVHVIDRVTSGPKPALVEDLGASYHTGAIGDLGLNPDIVVECTGVGELIQDAIDATAAGGIVCLTGIGQPSEARANPSAFATEAVLKNLVVFGSVNANRRHYFRASQALARADRAWLERLLTRTVRPDEVEQALERGPDDIKVVVEFAEP